ncbi:MAG: hypothetical protein Q9181_007518, partial [Wetmoreana brouardii]
TAAGLMAESPKIDHWGAASSVYAARAEYVTRPSAETLISWVNDLSPLSHSNALALDNGTGSGVVTISLRSRFPHLPIIAADLSPGMLETIEKKQLPKVQCKVLDATDLHSIANDTFTHSLSTFMVQFASKPRTALQEMYRVTKPNGTLGLCMWGEICFDAPWEETARHFEPDYVYPHAWTPDWADEDRLPRYVEDVGFKDVKLQTIRPRWDFQSPEEYFEYYFESKNPEFMRGYQPWWDKGMEGTMRPMFEKIVRERYGSAKDFDMKVFLIVATK